MRKRILSILICLTMVIPFLQIRTISVSAATSIVSGSEIKNAAKDAGIGSGSNAYKALELINAYSDDLTSSQKKGTLVFLFEGVGNDSNSNNRMNAMCVVIKGNQVKYINRNSTTIPDQPFKPSLNGNTPMPTLKLGVYSFTTVNHHSDYAALHVSGAKVLRFRSKSDYYDSTSDYINVHRRSSNDNRTSGWVNSQGCQLIGKAGTTASGEYAKFIQSIGIVDSNDAGNIKFKHSVKGKIIIDRSFAADYLTNIGYPKEAVKTLCGTTKTIPDPEPDDDLVKDTRYKTPISCVAYKKMDVYYSSGKVESGRYISAGDACTIDAVYTNGLCAVTYPTSSGTRDAYAKFKDFVPNPVSLSSYKAEKAYTTYTHSDKKKKYGSLSVNDACTVVGQTGNMYQLIYPISGGYKLGWIDKGELKDITKPIAEPDPVSETIPLAVAKGFFQSKKIVAMAPKKIEFSNTQYISKDDICIISDVNKTSGKCTVKYPSGSDDVFNASKTVTKTINITDMVTKYSDDYAVYKLKALKNYKVYPTSSKTDDKGRNWQLDKGDEYYTIAKSGSMTEVLYYCNRGAHEGYWKLGWIEIDYYYLDLNGYLDGEYNGKLTGYGYADITINGETIKKVQDYYKQVPYGSTYEIKNPTPMSRHTYNGVQVGSLSGTIKEKTQVQLNFTTNPPVLQDIYISSNPSKTEYLEGEWLDTNGLVVTARYDDASTQNVTGSCGISGYDSSPGVKTINVSFGGHETAFTVNVRSKSPTKIEVASLPSKLVYNTGDEIDLTGLTVKAIYDNGTSAIVDEYELYVEEGATAKEGQVEIGVIYEYNDVVQYASFEITVNAKYTFVDLGDDFTAYIQYPVNGKYITRDNDNNVTLRSNSGTDDQIWHFVKQENGQYKIYSATDDQFVLEVAQGSDASGANVAWWHDSSDPAQYWNIIQSQSGYRLKPQCSECMLDVAGGGDAADGANIQMWEYLEGGAQEFNINKTVPVTGVSVDKTDISLGVNETAKISARIQPQDATDQTVIWSSSDEAVATVAEDGSVTAKGLGNAVITVKTSDGSHTATCNVSVVVMPESISLDKTAIRLNGIGKSATLKATVSPENAADKTVTWESSNTAIATVTSNGKVTAKGVGSAKITAKTSNGKTAQCTVKVREFNISQTSLNLNVGDTETLAVNRQSDFIDISPDTKYITWTSSNKNVATVMMADSRGYSAGVTARAAGQAVITAKTNDGFEVSCTVTVTGTGASLTKPSITSIDDTSKTEITVKWNAVEGASSYRIDRRKQGDSDYTTVKQGISETQYTDSGLESGERYYYRVYAVNPNQTSVASTVIGGCTKSDEPNISSQSTSSIELSWSDIDNAESYTVRRRRYDGEYEDYATVNETSFTDNNVEAGTKYYYWIKANCKTDSEEYEVKSATSGQYTKLTAPDIVSENSAVKLRWQNANGKDTYSYRIMRKAASDQEYTELATVNDLEYTDDSIEANTVYYYYVDVLINNELCISSDTSSTEKASVSIGDVNGDGEIDVADAVLIMKHDAGLAEIADDYKAAADVNKDGEIDIADAILIMKYDAGLINKL